jgi:hypothetical protein
MRINIHTDGAMHREPPIIRRPLSLTTLTAASRATGRSPGTPIVDEVDRAV